MKFFYTISILFFYTFINGQSVEKSKIKVQLFVPAFSKIKLKSTDKLTVYLLTFPEDAPKSIPKKLIAIKQKDNSFEINLPKVNYWKIGFGISNFSSNLLCIILTELLLKTIVLISI